MVIVVATVANLIGSTIAYAVGRYGGRALLSQIRPLRPCIPPSSGQSRALVRPSRRADGLLHPHDAGSTHLHLPPGGDSPDAGGQILALFGSGLHPVERGSCLPGLLGRKSRWRGSLGKATGAVQPLQPHLLHSARCVRGRPRRLGPVALAPAPDDAERQGAPGSEAPVTGGPEEDSGPEKAAGTGTVEARTAETVAAEATDRGEAEKTGRRRRPRPVLACRALRPRAPCSGTSACGAPLGSRSSPEDRPPPLPLRRP